MRRQHQSVPRSQPCGEGTAGRTREEAGVVDAASRSARRFDEPAVMQNAQMQITIAGRSLNRDRDGRCPRAMADIGPPGCALSCRPRLLLGWRPGNRGCRARRWRAARAGAENARRPAAAPRGAHAPRCRPEAACSRPREEAADEATVLALAPASDHRAATFCPCRAPGTYRTDRLALDSPDGKSSRRSRRGAPANVIGEYQSGSSLRRPASRTDGADA